MDTQGTKSRAWCSKPVPSIYAWVQTHYWWVDKQGVLDAFADAE